MNGNVPRRRINLVPPQSLAEKQIIDRLRKTQELLARRLESAGVVGLKRDPVTGRPVLSEEQLTKLARGIQTRLRNIERTRPGYQVPRALHEPKKSWPVREPAWPKRKQIGIRDVVPKPGSADYEMLVKDINSAQMKLLASGEVKDPKIAREIARKRMVPYSLDQRRIFINGVRDYARTYRTYAPFMHPSYGYVLEAPTKGYPEQPKGITTKPEKRGVVPVTKFPKPQPITPETLAAVRKRPTAEGVLTLVPARDKETRTIHHFPTDELEKRLKSEPGRWEHVGPVRYVKRTQVSRPTKLQIGRTARMLGEEKELSGFRIGASGATTKTTSVSKIGYPEKIYGRPGERGYWHDIEVMEMPTFKSAHLTAKEKIVGNFDEWFHNLPREERIGWEVASNTASRRLKSPPRGFPVEEIKRFMKARNARSLTPKAWAEFCAFKLAHKPDSVVNSRTLGWEAKALAKGLASKRWHLPKKLLIAIGAAGVMGAALWPEEAEASEAGTVARGVAAATLRHKVLHPGYKRNDWSFIVDPKKREELERFEDQIERANVKGKTGRDFFASMFAAWIGEKWASDIWMHGDEKFDPSLAGYIVGELPLWLLGGKIMHTAIKGGGLGAKLLRSVGTGMIGRSIPESVQVIHGDKTLGEAAMSTVEEGAIWGAIDLVMKPLGGAAKYFVGAGKWNPKVPVTPEIVNGVEKSLLQRAVTFWPEKIGGPMWDGLVKLFKSIPGFERMFIPAVSRMNPEGADVFRKRIANIGLKLDDAYQLASKAYRGLSRNESFAATDLLRGVHGAKVIKDYGIGLKRLNEIQFNHVRPIRRAFQERGGEAVLEGLLHQDTYIKNIETYVPRMFWPQIKGLQEYVDEVAVKPFKPMGRKLRLELKRFMRRRDLPPELLQKMDMVNDVSYLTWRGLKDVIHDVETAKMFNKISIQKNNFAYATKKITEGEMKEIAHPLTKKPVFVRNESWLKKNGWMKLPGAKVKGAPKAQPGLYEFGALRGGWVPKEVHQELMELGRVPGRYELLFSHILSKWKYGKVILRPATHARNLISNLILNDLGGLPFWKLHRYAEGARALKQREKNVFFKEALDEGLLTGGSFVRRELGGYWGTERNVVDRMLGRIGKGGGTKLYNAWHKMRGGVRWLGEKPSRLYDVEEKLFKMAKFIDNRKKGMIAKEAAADAMKWTFNYGEITPFIRGVRTWAMPFVTFSYKAIPIVAETALKHPLRFAKWPMMAMGLTYASLDSLDIDARHWNYIKRVLPKYMRAGHYMMLPYKDEKNRLQFVDLTYILPWGDIGELSQQGALRIMQNPAAQLTAQLSMNKNFYGQPIWYEWEKPKVKAFKALSHIWRTMMPSWTPDLALGMDPTVIGGYDWYNFIRACKQVEEGAPTPRQFAASMVGVKTRPIEPHREAVKRKRGKDWQVREAKAYYKRLMRDNPDAVRDLMEARIKALDQIEDEYRRGGGYSRLNPLRYVD